VDAAADVEDAELAVRHAHDAVRAGRELLEPSDRMLRAPLAGGGSRRAEPGSAAA
jgi:hypothetical protein